MQFEAKFVGMSAQGFLAFKLFLNMRGGAFPKWAGEGGGLPPEGFGRGPPPVSPTEGGGPQALCAIHVTAHPLER